MTNEQLQAGNAEKKLHATVLKGLDGARSGIEDVLSGEYPHRNRTINVHASIPEQSKALLNILYALISQFEAQEIERHDKVMKSL